MNIQYTIIIDLLVIIVYFKSVNCEVDVNIISG